MRFGIMFTNAGPFASADGAVAIAGAAEDAGFESVWTVEHVVVPQGYESEYPYDPSGRMPAPDDIDLPDPLIWLSFVAAATSTIRLGTGILILPQRNPAVTAKAVASLDKLSEGRALLGIGAGWLEEEFDALGIPFADRGARTDDHIEAVRALWTQSPATYEGTHTSFRDVHSAPKPVAGTVPIIVGGHSKPAARRAGRLGDGFFPGKGSNDELRELITTMRHAAEGAGRDPGAIEITAGGQAAFAPDPAEAIGEFEEMGVSRLIIPPLAFDPGAIGSALADFGRNVVQKFA